MVDIVVLLDTTVNRPHPPDGYVATLSRQDHLDRYFCTLTSFKRYPIAAIFVALLAGTPPYF